MSPSTPIFLEECKDQDIQLLDMQESLNETHFFTAMGSFDLNPNIYPKLVTESYGFHNLTPCKNCPFDLHILQVIRKEKKQKQKLIDG